MCFILQLDTLGNLHPMIYIKEYNKLYGWSFIFPSSQHSHLRPLQVLSSSNLSLNQMIAVDGGGDSHLGQTTANELKHCHLSRGILHGHPVGTQAQVRAATIDLLPSWVV